MSRLPLALVFALACALAPTASAAAFSYDGHYTNYYASNLSGLGNGFPQYVYINTSQVGSGKAGEFYLSHNVTNCSLYCYGSLYASNSPSKEFPYGFSKMSGGPSPTYAFSNLYVSTAGVGTGIGCDAQGSACKPYQMIMLNFAASSPYLSGIVHTGVNPQQASLLLLSASCNWSNSFWSGTFIPTNN